MNKQSYFPTNAVMIIKAAQRAIDDGKAIQQKERELQIAEVMANKAEPDTVRELWQRFFPPKRLTREQAIKIVDERKDELHVAFRNGVYIHGWTFYGTGRIGWGERMLACCQYLNEDKVAYLSTDDAETLHSWLKE